jgi:hypothetical protein
MYLILHQVLVSCCVSSCSFTSADQHLELQQVQQLISLEGEDLEEPGWGVALRGGSGFVPSKSACLSI